MKILCVEDGSVDIEAIKEEGLKDGGILVYRSGSNPPFVLDIPNDKVILYKKFEKCWQELKEYTQNYVYMSDTAKNIIEKMHELERIWKDE